jgi:hypothetical protein
LRFFHRGLDLTHLLENFAECWRGIVDDLEYCSDFKTGYHCFCSFIRIGIDAASNGRTMIRNGLYAYSSKALDGVIGGANGVMILRNGEMLGGTDHFFFIGTYSCSGGKWKGEMTNQEHTPAPAPLPTAGKGLVAAGFAGTYTDKDAEFYATVLVGKQSLQYHATLRLLKAD